MAVRSPSGPEEETFAEVQRRFTRHIRDHSCPAPSDVEDRRMQIYRDLLYRNVEGLLAGGFPVLRKISSDEYWHSLVRGYFRDHASRTPLYPMLSREFLQYLQTDRERAPEDPPYLQELAHYEWVEQEASFDPREISLAGVDSDGDLIAGAPVLNPLARLLSYRYPVHRIRPDFLPQEPLASPLCLVVCRDRDDRVRFLELSIASARLLDLLRERPGATGRELLRTIADELGQGGDSGQLLRFGRELLQSLRERDVVLGTAAGYRERAPSVADGNG